MSRPGYRDILEYRDIPNRGKYLDTAGYSRIQGSEKEKENTVLIF